MKVIERVVKSEGAPGTHDLWLDEDNNLEMKVYHKGEWKPIAGGEGGSSSGTDSNAVHFTEQSLTTEQKSQARTNIGAADDSQVLKTSSQSLTDAQKNQVKQNLGITDGGGSGGSDADAQKSYSEPLPSGYAPKEGDIWAQKVMDTVDDTNDLVDGSTPGTGSGVYISAGSAPGSHSVSIYDGSTLLLTASAYNNYADDNYGFSVQDANGNAVPRLDSEHCFYPYEIQDGLTAVTTSGSGILHVFAAEAKKEYYEYFDECGGTVKRSAIGSAVENAQLVHPVTERIEYEYDLKEGDIFYRNEPTELSENLVDSGTEGDYGDVIVISSRIIDGAHTVRIYDGSTLIYTVEAVLDNIESYTNEFDLYDGSHTLITTGDCGDTFIRPITIIDYITAETVTGDDLISVKVGYMDNVCFERINGTSVPRTVPVNIPEPTDRDTNKVLTVVDGVRHAVEWRTPSGGSSGGGSGIVTMLEYPSVGDSFEQINITDYFSSQDAQTLFGGHACGVYLAENVENGESDILYTVVCNTGGVHLIGNSLKGFIFSYHDDDDEYYVRRYDFLNQYQCLLNATPANNMTSLSDLEQIGLTSTHFAQMSTGKIKQIEFVYNDNDGVDDRDIVGVASVKYCFRNQLIDTGESVWTLVFDWLSHSYRIVWDDSDDSVTVTVS